MWSEVRLVGTLVGRVVTRSNASSPFEASGILEIFYCFIWVLLCRCGSDCRNMGVYIMIYILVCI